MSRLTGVLGGLEEWCVGVDVPGDIELALRVRVGEVGYGESGPSGTTAGAVTTPPSNSGSSFSVEWKANTSPAQPGAFQARTGVP
jgi:hypothetical protein